jgi:Leucine-rich repeat (LRR) protein
VKRILLPFLCLIVFFQDGAFSQTRALDSIALRAFYTATGGSSWSNHTNWLSGPINNWYGITLNTTTHRVNKIELPNNGLTGKLPSVIGNLTGLRWLYLNGNNLIDTLPKSLRNLTTLITLNIEHNKLRRDLPDMSGLNMLAELYLQNNYLTFSDLNSSGLTPDDVEVFGYSPQDTIPAISYNIDNGTITVEVDVDPANYFKWYKNGLLISETAQTIIPPGEGLYNCEITNTVYPGLTLYSQTYNLVYSRKSDSLALVSLYNATNGPAWGSRFNWLVTGKSINSWFGITLNGNQRVSKIKLNSNQLKGILPDKLANLSQLVSLKINNNKLKGNLPPLHQITTIDTIWVNNNKFDFANLSISQIQPGDIKSFIYAPQDTVPKLIFNQYEGTLTMGVGVDTSNIYSWFFDETPMSESTRTIVLREGGAYNCLVSNSIFTGMTFYSDTVGAYFSMVSDSLALVHLYNDTDGPHWKNHTNWLTGKVNTWYGITVSGNRVRKVLLGNNGLSGTIPSQIGNLALLTELNLSNNKLIDSIPADIGQLSGLTQLKLNSNELSGDIPSEIYDLVYLTDLDLEFNQLTDTIPIEIGNLTRLTSLKLSNNNLTGDIPDEIGNLTNLTVLSLSNNHFTGSIPVVIGDLTKLRNLQLDGNELTGTIPLKYGTLTALIQLSLNGNQLSGSIPDTIKNLTHLNYLSLGDNQLTGKIPSVIGKLSELTNLFLQNNQFSDSLTSEIGKLSSLKNLNLRGNKLSGSIPSKIENLKSLITLYLDSNQFIGDLPYLSNAPLLSELSVNNNQFTFSNLISSDILPEDIDNFIYAPQDTLLGLQYTFASGTLTVLDDNEPLNAFTWYKDSIQLDDTTKVLTMKGEGSYDCEVVNPLFPDLVLYSDTFHYSYSPATDSIALVTLYNETDGPHWSYHTNWKTGQMSTWYGITLDESHRVSKIELSSNNLTGTLPPEIGNLTHLKWLHLQDNSLSGMIPSEIGELALLTELKLNGNQISGTIPDRIGELASLTTLYLNDNQLSGSIPIGFGELSNLTYLCLDINQLSGAIPSEIGHLTNLETLNLSQNQLSGNIPSSFDSLSNLYTLNLSGNELSGQIPEEIGNIGGLSMLNIDNNKFHFAAIEPIFYWDNYPFSSFTYSPQAKIGVAQTIPGYIGYPLVIGVEGYNTAEHDAFKWYKNDGILTGETDSMLVFPSFAESDTGIYYCEVKNSKATLLTLTSNDIKVVKYVVPTNLSLTNVVVGKDESVCYDATLDITVAGNSTTVYLQDGSNTSFIAGHSIRFLLGFHAFSGSYMDASITTTASFCEPPAMIISADGASEKSAYNNIQVPGDQGQIEKSVKIFPNPNNGRFTLALTNFEGLTHVIISNTSGAVVYKMVLKDLSNSEYDISHLPKGLYLIHIQNEKDRITRKIIVQ